jgi:hypothetical protein
MVEVGVKNPKSQIFWSGGNIYAYTKFRIILVVLHFEMM